jgi:hypothetical protein
LRSEPCSEESLERRQITPRMKTKVTLSLASAIISFLIAVAFGETYVRLFSPVGYITPAIRKSRSLQYIPSLFSRHVFPQRELTADGWDGAKWYINEKGYRGHDFTIDKPEGTIRIIFYGGSAVFDPVATDGKDWPHRVEDILKQSGFSNVEVINAGIPGHASWDAFGRFFAEGHVFNPDYVVLYSAWNDIKYFQSDKPLLRTFLPFIASSDPRLDYQSPLDRFLCEKSQLYVRLRDRYYEWKLRIGVEGQKPSGEYSSEINELGLKQYRINVEMFVDLARNIDAVPILMTQGRLVARNNTEEQKARIFYDYQQLTHQALCEAFEGTDKAIYDVVKEKNVFLIDASKYITGKDELFRDHVHLTEKGSEELAIITAHEIAKILESTR